MSYTKKTNQQFPHHTTEEWIAAIRKTLKTPDDIQKIIWDTGLGFNLNAFYREENKTDLKLNNKPAFTHNNWQTRVPVFVDNNVAEANKIALSCLENGADEILFTGLKAPDPEQMDKLFKNIHLDWFPSWYDFGEDNLSFYFAMVDYFKTLGITPKNQQFNIRIDPLTDFYLKGKLQYSINDVFETLTLTLNHAAEAEKVKVLTVNANQIHECGGNIVQELGVAAAQLVEYLHQLTDKGCNVDEIISKLEIQLSVGPAYLLEVAKFRAAHIIFNRIVQQFSKHAKTIAINATTSQRFMSIYDVHTNMLRQTGQAMSAISGGCNSLTIYPYNFWLDKPTVQTTEIAKNISLLLAYEAGFDMFTDVANGSYYIEAATEKIAFSAWQHFQHIEREGGFLAALQSKYIQKSVEQNAQLQAKAFQKADLCIVGSNKYVLENEKLKPKLKKTPEAVFPERDLDILPLKPSRITEKLDKARLTKE